MKGTPRRELRGFGSPGVEWLLEESIRIPYDGRMQAVMWTECQEARAMGLARSSDPEWTIQLSRDKCSIARACRWNRSSLCIEKVSCEACM